MAEHRNASNNGHSPFRRYVPSTNADNRPLPKPAAAPSPAPGPTSSGNPPARRQRPARNRWRQWVQSVPSQASAPPAPRANAPAPQTRPPGPPRAGENQRGAQPPVDVPTPTRVTRSSNPEPSPLVRPAVPGSQSGSRAPGASRLRVPQFPTPTAHPRSPQAPAAKVTPIRPQPAWATPTDETNPESRPPRRSRKGARRSNRRAPQPILYGIRLLILGTGIAAIAGTVLSTLNPAHDEAVSGAANPGLTAPSTPQMRSGSQTALALSAPLPVAEELSALKTDLVALEAMTPGLTQALYFYDLETGNYVNLNGDTSVAAASTIKVPILVAFLAAVDAGTIRLDQALTLQEGFIAGGSGDMQTHALGSQYTALEVATEMIINSDNTATNLMIALLGGPEALNRQFQAWGLEHTTLRNLLPDLEGTNTTSAADLVRLMALVDQGEILTQRSRDRLFGIMQRTYNRTLIPDGLGDTTALAYNKTGDIGAVLGDIALVDVANGKRYVLGVLVTRPHNDGRANELIRRLAARIHEDMSQPVSPVGGTPLTAPTSAPATGTETVAPEAAPVDPTVPPLEPVDPTVPSLEPVDPTVPPMETDLLPESDSFTTPEAPQG